MNAIVLLDAAEEAARIRAHAGDIALRHAADRDTPAIAVLASEVAILADLIERVCLLVAKP